MNKENKSLGILEGLKLVKDQWAMLSIAVLASIIILTLDFLLTTSMPKVIEGLQSLMSSQGNLVLSPSLIILVSLIILRPLIGWTINFIQISIILNILRKLETDIASKSNYIFNENLEYSSENSANMLISHGRYFVDNYLIPLIRAITDAGTIIVISVGIFIQYPLPLTFFILSAVISLSTYQLLSKNLLRRNGEICLRCYENIMVSSKNGFNINHECINEDEIELNKSVKIHDVLDQKKKATIIIGSISQGLKYVVEFCFMLSFGVATLVMFLYSPGQFAAFVATFAYAGVRMLPSFTSIISFFQTRSSAEFAVKELLMHLISPKSK
jgi:hypothetical protein|tara:strand:- start:1080 stop:2063 length:984 start_codon:yes stop_codon:yes gene_type:complete